MCLDFHKQIEVAMKNPQKYENIVQHRLVIYVYLCIYAIIYKYMFMNVWIYYFLSISENIYLSYYIGKELRHSFSTLIAFSLLYS